MDDYNPVQKMVQAKMYGIADQYTESIDGYEILKVNFQTGGTATNKKNGVFIEDLLAVALGRLNDYNKEFPSRENSIAITHIEEAILQLYARKVERTERNVYGKEEL